MQIVETWHIDHLGLGNVRLQVPRKYHRQNRIVAGKRWMATLSLGVSLLCLWGVSGMSLGLPLVCLCGISVVSLGCLLGVSRGVSVVDLCCLFAFLSCVFVLICFLSLWFGFVICMVLLCFECYLFCTFF